MQKNSDATVERMDKLSSETPVGFGKTVNNREGLDMDKLPQPSKCTDQILTNFRNGSTQDSTFVL